jgi:hypothetical protein
MPKARSPESLPTLEQIKQSIRYCPDTGNFFRTVSKGRVKAGDKADAIFGNGHSYVRALGVAFKSSRLAYCFMTGSHPGERDEIDHLNHNPLDNRWKNLRIANRSQNLAWRRKRAIASSQFKGVTFSKVSNKWRAYGTLPSGKQKHLGYFENEFDAATAYNVYASKIYSDFAFVNRW